MTESEALEYVKLFREDWDRNSKTKNAMALDVAISALEEVQKIKELGDCYIIPKNSTWEVNGIDIHKALEEIQQYRAIGTVSEFRQLKEKATAKNPIEAERNNLTVWDCPQCGNELYSGQKFCDECGKAIADEFE